MSTPRPLASRPRAARPSGLCSTKTPALTVCLSLLALALLALTPTPARAQWVACDASGNPNNWGPDGDNYFQGFYLMSHGDGTVAGTNGGGTTPAQASPFWYYYYPSPYLPSGGSVVIDDDIIGPGGGVSAKNGAYGGQGVTSHGGGTLTVTMKRYFLWQGSGTPLTGPSLLLMTQLIASAGSAYTSNPAGVYPAPLSGLSATSSATDDQFGETVSATAPTGTDPNRPWPIYLTDSHLSGGLHLFRAPVSQIAGGKWLATVTLSGQTQASASDGMDGLSYRSGASAGAQIEGGVKQDNRAVTISDPTEMKVSAYNADGSVSYDEYGDQNFVAAAHVTIGDTTYGDTVYSYDSDFDGGTGNHVANEQTFTAAFSGNWPWQSEIDQGGNTVYDVRGPDTWSWSPSGGVSDTRQSTKAGMPPAQNFHLFNEVPQGQDTPQEYDVSYSGTDHTDGATASAKYVMLVHDPYEKNYTDHPLYQKPENLKTYPHAQWVFNSDTKPADLEVHTDTSQSVDITISAAGPLEEWLGKALGITFDVSASYEVGVGQGVTVKDVLPGYGTYCMSCEVVNYHRGKVDHWGPGGYLGTSPYNIRVHADPPVGITNAPLVLMGGAPPKPPQ